MKKNTKLKYLPIAAFAAVAVALAGCGGGGGSPVTSDDTAMAGPMIVGATVPSGTMITLPAGVDIQDGTIRADMGDTVTVDDIGAFMCVSAGGCSVDLTDGVITTTGDITVVSLDVTDPDILAQLAALLPTDPADMTEPDAATDVTQVGTEADTEVAAVRNSAGDVTGIMVGDVEISTILKVKNKGDVEPAGVEIGVIAQNEGIRTRHVDLYANLRPAVGARIIGAVVDENDEGTRQFVVEALDADNVVPAEDAIDLPLGSESVPALNVPVMAGKGMTTDDFVALFETGTDANDLTDDDDLKLYRLAVNQVVDGVTTQKNDELGNPVWRYFIAVAPSVMKDDSGGSPTTIPQVIELTVVEEESKTIKAREKEASAFEYLAYGVWATVEKDGAAYKHTGLGNGYLIASDADMTPLSNMPVTGTATFEGQYTSYVKRYGTRGTISEASGDVTMTANFARDSMSVELTDQFGSDNALTLTGTIDGNEFAGTGLKQFDDGDLQSDGATAEMAGAFYGLKLDEAGGVYDVLGGREKNPGRVVGSFGGVNTQ